MDYLMNGQGYGGVASRLLNNGFDHNVLRPFVAEDGRSYVNTINANGEIQCNLLHNSAASLRRDEWLMIDQVVVTAAKPRLRIFNDLRSAGGTVSIPGGMGKTSILYETMGDITEASISMDGLNQSEEDRAEFDSKLMPLPLVHKDFSFTARQIAVSRQGGSPLDTTTASLAARRVAEQIEKLTLGISSSYSFGGGTVYGFTNFPNRNTKSMTLPTSGGWTPSTTVGEILDMIQIAMDDYFYGPFALYYSPAWARYMGDDYSAAKGDNTLQQRIMAVDSIGVMRQADYLSGYQMLLVQLTPDVARAIMGMDITTVQWESHGGFRLHFKVLALMVPQIRADQANQCGIVHGTAA